MADLDIEYPFTLRGFTVRATRLQYDTYSRVAYRHDVPDCDIVTYNHVIPQSVHVAIGLYIDSPAYHHMSLSDFLTEVLGDPATWDALESTHEKEHEYDY